MLTSAGAGNQELIGNVYWALGSLRFNRGEYLDAKDAFNAAAESYEAASLPGPQGMARRQTMHICHRLGDVECGLNAYGQIKIYSDDWFADHVILAELLEQKYGLQGALGLVTTALETAENEERAFFHAVKGNILAKAGRNAEAGVAYRVATHSTERPEAYNVACWHALTKERDLEDAHGYCLGAVLNRPESAAYYDSAGLYHLLTGSDDSAELRYSQALKLDPDRAHSLYGRSIARHRRGQYEEARVDRARAIELDPTLPAAYDDYFKNVGQSQ